MKPKYLLDTDVFSFMVKGQDAAINTRLQSLTKGEAVLSVITAGEFYYGVAHAPVSALRDQRAQRLLDFFGLLPLDGEVATRYGTVRAELRRAGYDGPAPVFGETWHSLFVRVSRLVGRSATFEAAA